MIMRAKQLFDAGFSEKEAEVYLAILELGEGNIAQVARKSGIKRATVYLEIDALREKGYVSTVKRRGRSIYLAENPQRIEQRLAEKQEAISKLMPELLSIANVMEHKPKVRYFEGTEGLKEIYKDTLSQGSSEIAGWYSDDRVLHFDKSFILDYYMKKRLEKKIPMRMFAIESAFMGTMQGHDKQQLRQMKLIKPGNYAFASEINLYGTDKVAIIAHRENMGLIIESKKIFDTLKGIFEIMWGSL